VVSGFPFGFFKVNIQTLKFCCINCLCVSTQLCNKAYCVKIDAKLAYFVVTAKMRNANLNPDSKIFVDQIHNIRKQ